MLAVLSRTRFLIFFPLIRVIFSRKFVHFLTLCFSKHELQTFHPSLIFLLSFMNLDESAWGREMVHVQGWGLRCFSDSFFLFSLDLGENLFVVYFVSILFMVRTFFTNQVYAVHVDSPHRPVYLSSASSRPALSSPSCPHPGLLHPSPSRPRAASFPFSIHYPDFVLAL